MYEYVTPDGYGDSFFIYAVNGEDLSIVNGNSYALLGLPVSDGQFVCRAWAGGEKLVDPAGTIQIYDTVRRAWFFLPILLSNNFPPAMAVLPEKIYDDNSNFRFDISNVLLQTNVFASIDLGTTQVYADQMVFYGSKRVPGGAQDPAKSTYNYYEKSFKYPFTFQLNDYGPSDALGNPVPGLGLMHQFIILITDYDFELRRVGIDGVGIELPYTSPFKILLYDATWRQRSNIPIMSEFLCHNVNINSGVSTMPDSNWPSPPLLYPVNSVIRFDIFSLLPVNSPLPLTFSLLFDGVRRINCQ